MILKTDEKMLKAGDVYIYSGHVLFIRVISYQKNLGVLSER